MPDKRGGFISAGRGRRKYNQVAFFCGGTTWHTSDGGLTWTRS